MDVLVARAARDGVATCTVQEIVDGRESRQAREGFVEREGIRRAAQVREII